MILNYSDLLDYWYSDTEAADSNYETWIKSQGASLKIRINPPDSLADRLVIDISEEDLIILKLKYKPYDS